MTGDQSPPSTPDTSKQSFEQPLQDRSSERPRKIARVKEEDTIGEEADEEGGEDQLEMRVNPNPRIQRYLIAIEYIGTRFSGAQQQSNARTVVGVLAVKFLTCLDQFGKFRAFIMSDYFGDIVFVVLGILVYFLFLVFPQEAFHKFIGQPVSIFCSSRTVSI